MWTKTAPGITRLEIWHMTLATVIDGCQQTSQRVGRPFPALELAQTSEPDAVLLHLPSHVLQLFLRMQRNCSPWPIYVRLFCPKPFLFNPGQIEKENNSNALKAVKPPRMCTCLPYKLHPCHGFPSIRNSDTFQTSVSGSAASKRLRVLNRWAGLWGYGLWLCAISF